jgi:hypothetical protein
MAAGVLFTAADPDLWGHVLFGLDILERGEVRAPIERYSFTADRPFVYHEWLGGTIMALAYRAAGPLGLQLLKGALAGSLFAVLWLRLRRAVFLGRWGGLALAAAGMLPMLASIRPQVWSALAIVIVTSVLMSPSRRAPFVLPPIFALWANLHGGWIVGGGVFVIVTFWAFFEREPRRWSLLVAGVGSLIATLATPYGVALWMFLAETVRFSRSDIVEWLPIWRIGLAPTALWAATVAVVFVTHRRQRLPARTLVVLVALGCAAALVVRVAPLFTLTAVTMLSDAWRGEEPRLAPHATRTLLDGIAVAVGVVTLLANYGNATCVAFGGRLAPDTVVAEALRGSSGRLASFFDWGEYAMWHFGPRLQVSIDGRRETVYREATLRAQQQVVDGTPLGLSTLARMRPDYVWLPAWSPTRAWVESNGYRIDVISDRSFIATRSDHPPLKAWEGTSSGCFPGP